MQKTTSRKKELLAAIKWYHDENKILQVTQRNAHYYQKGNCKLYPSPTTFLGMLSKGGLQIWRERLIRDDIMNTMQYAADGHRFTYNEVMQIVSEAFTAPDVARDKAATFGTRVHNTIEAWVNGQTTLPPKGGDKEVSMAVAAAHKFLQDNGIEPVYSEMKIFHEPNRPHPGYGGTIDLIGLQDDGVVIVDWKTGSLYPTQQIQVAGYAHAFSRYIEPVKDAYVFSTKTLQHSTVNLIQDYDTFLKMCALYDATHTSIDLYA